MVVSTLWAVDDRSSELLMKRFYQSLLGFGRSPLAPAFALREAQQWLRDATVEDLGSDSEDVATSPKTNVNDRPFSHPNYWAAFTFSGPHFV